MGAVSPRDWRETGWRSPVGERRAGGTLSLPYLWLHTAHGIPTTHIVASFSCWHCNRMLARVTVGYLRHLRSLNSCHCLTSVTSALTKPSSSLHPDILLVCSLLLYFFRWILLCSTKDLKQLVACWNVCPSLYGPLGMCDVGFSETLLCAGAGGHSWVESTLSTWVSRVTLIY